MFRLLIWLFIIYAGYRIIKHLLGAGKEPSGIAEERQEAEVTYRDPVCGLYVSEADAVVGKLNGQRHYFCSMNCLEKFREQLDHKP